MIQLRALALIATLLISPAAAQQVVHGADSLFVAPTVKLAWAVRRGASEAETLVVIRIVGADAAYRVIRVDGIDPFTKDHKVFVAARPLDREIDIALPRSGFADHPSTEIYFFANAEDAAANRPRLTVFYLGVPDTTPEFATPHDVEAYFAHILRAKK